MKQFLTLILASGLMLACSGDSKDEATTDDITMPNVVSEADAEEAAEATMDTTEGASAELDKLAKELDG